MNASKRHQWQNSDRCTACGLNREGAGAGRCGAMRYYFDDAPGYHYKAPACLPKTTEVAP